MKSLQFLLLSSSILVLSSCTFFEGEKFNVKSDVKQIIFFSDDQNYQKEDSYYDALIELKSRFPNEIKNMLVLSSNSAKPYYRAYHIESCPALLVIYNNEVVVKIIGTASKEDIIKPLTEALLTKPPEKVN